MLTLGLGLLLQGVLDLHGLHVQEAVELLDSILPALIRAKVKEATILTGSGHHSGGAGGREG